MTHPSHPIPRNSPKKPGGANRALYLARRWHEWLGVFAALFICTLGFTGIYLNHKPMFEGWMGLRPKGMIRPQPTGPLTTANALSLPLIPLEKALAEARVNLGEAELEHLQLKAERGGLVYKFKGQGGLELVLDANSGRVLQQLRPTTGLKISKLVVEVHSGAILGTGGRLVVDLASFAILTLTGTGLYLWAAPKLKKRAKKKGVTQASVGPDLVPAPAFPAEE